MSRNETIAPHARSWRDIPQQVKPRAMSTEGRRRLVFGGVKTIVAMLVVGGLTWGGFEVAAALRGKSPPKAAAEQAVPVKDVVLVTDGVLDRKWLVRTLAIPKDASLLELDLYQLRSRLMASGQVRSATLTRNFPATLTVGISEQSPMVRVNAQRGAEEPRMLLVARDGTVFEGVGFDADMVATLPWLDGVKLTRQGDSFAPIAGMEKVGDLLGKAKLETEHLYKTWKVVSLALLESDGEIEVRADNVGKIYFGTTEDFFRQLARLDALLEKAQAQTDRPIREINLAIGAQVPVAFEDPVVETGAAKATAAHPPAAGTAKPALPAFPNLQRKSKL